MLTSEDIRKKWKEFWEHPERNHKHLPPDKLVPTHWDTTAMFTLAWMQQLVPYLMWKPHPLGKRLYNIQKCIRTNDIEEVGDERHLTFFEMMWNWSLGDYFKKEAITWSRQFLTDYLWIDIDKLGATVFKWEDGIPKDEESKKIWQEQWISPDKIRELGKEDNFWGPAGEVGPCGPCTEIYFDRGDLRGPSDWNLWENDRYLEIRNDVFMEYYKGKKSEEGAEEVGRETSSAFLFRPLPNKNVDTGMGLERITMVMQWVPTVFETDLFVPILQVIEKYAEKDYPLKKLFYNNIQNLSDKEIKNVLSQISSKLTSSKTSSESSSSDFLSFSLQTSTILKRFRIIADHIRSSVFLIGDGVIPSNEWRGYVLRRLIRRLYYNLILLNPNSTLDQVKDFIQEITEVIANKYWPWRSEVKDEKDNIAKVLLEEISKFNQTIKRGLSLIETEFTKLQNKIVPGEIVFKLYDTYGFPVELTQEITQTKGFEIDIDWFKELMQQAKEKSRQATKEVFKRWVDWWAYLEGLPPTEFVWYEQLELENPKLLKDFTVEINWQSQRVLVFDKTPFYAESGGQTADKGEIILDNWEVLKVKDVQKYAGVVLHFVEG